MQGKASVASESRRDRLRQPFFAVNQVPTQASPKTTSDAQTKITGRLTIDELLSEGNLAGLPENYRHARKGEHDKTQNASEDEEQDMDVCSGEEDAGSKMSGDPLLLYPTRGGKSNVNESKNEDVSKASARTRTQED